MKTIKFFVCLIVFLLLGMCNVKHQLLAQPGALPDSIKQERKAYLEAQVSDQDKVYLEKLKVELVKLAKLNDTSASYWSAFPNKNEAIDLIEGRFNEAKKKAANYIFGEEQTTQNFAQEMGDFVVDNLPKTGKMASASATASGFLFAAEVINLIQFFQVSMEIKDLLVDAANGTQTWSGFTLEMYRRDKWPFKILEDEADEFRRAAQNYTSPLGIKDLKEFLEMEVKYSDGVINDMDFLYKSYTGGSNDWCKALLKRLFPITIQQLKVNRDFCVGVLARVQEMAGVKEPRPPWLIPVSAEVIVPQGKKAEELRKGDEVIVAAEFKNIGDLNAPKCVAGLQFCEAGGDCARVIPVEQSMPDLAPGATCRVEWKQPLRFLKNTFVVLAKREGERWDEISLGERKGVGFNLSLVPELSVEFTDIPERILVNNKAHIKVCVKNEGNIYSHMPRVKLTAAGEAIGEIICNDVENNGKPVDLTFDWTPKKKGNYNLVCEVSAGALDKPDIDKTNNTATARVEVFLTEHAWKIVENSLAINPPNPKVGEKVNIYFNVVNNGSESNINANVFVDNENIKQLALNVSPESEQRIGASGSDAITWNARGGSHKIQVILDPMKTPNASIEKTFSIATLMPGVEGIDLVLDKKYVSYKDGKVLVGVYNRGSQTAPAPLLTVREFPSDSKGSGDVIFSRNLSDVKSHELRSISLDARGYNCKFIITVDQDNKIKEADENNNQVELIVGTYHAYEPPRDIRTEGPDLIVAEIVNLDSAIELGEVRPITISVGNLNTVEAKNFKVEYEFWNMNLNDITPSHGYMKGEKIFSSIPAEEKQSFIVDYKGVYPGDYKLTLNVDPGLSVKETNEYNNKMEKYFNVSGEITANIYFAGKDVDLSIDKNVKVSNLKPSAGLPVSFEVTAHNNTGIVVWGADLDMLVNDKLESGEALGDFAANSSRKINFKHTFDTSGDFVVKFMVDAKKAVPEKNENNNTATVNIEVKPGILGTGHKDVAVMSLTLSKTSCIQGEPVTAEAVIKNVGKDTLNAVLCTIGPKGTTPFYVKILPVLDPGEEVKISTTLPALFAGEHIIEARVDGKNIIKEENEKNNVQTATINVEPITKEKIASQAVSVVVDKANKVMEAINKWLRGLGQPRK